MMNTARVPLSVRLGGRLPRSISSQCPREIHARQAASTGRRDRFYGIPAISEPKHCAIAGPPCRKDAATGAAATRPTPESRRRRVPEAAECHGNPSSLAVSAETRRGPRDGALVLPHVILLRIASSTMLLTSSRSHSGRPVGRSAQGASDASEGKSPWPSWIWCGAIGRSHFT